MADDILSMCYCCVDRSVFLGSSRVDWLAPVDECSAALDGLTSGPWAHFLYIRLYNPFIPDSKGKYLRNISNKPLIFFLVGLNS